MIDSPDENDQPRSSASANSNSSADVSKDSHSHSSYSLTGSLLSYQARRWRQGTSVSLEELFRSTDKPLSEDEQLSLICNDIVLREIAGQKPTLEEYQARFPHLTRQLAIQWEIDQLLLSVDEIDNLESWTQHGQANESIKSTLDRFTIQASLGSGGMGRVFLATDNRLKRVVALKHLTDRAARHSGARVRFAREAELIAQLNDPHIVPIFETGEEAGVPYIAMEYCPGGSLQERLRRGPLDAKMAAEVVRQISLGIDAAHRISVVHRDLKPGNILLTSPLDSNKSIHVKISDFGAARRIDDIEGFTQTGDILGTPSYMAPEQLEGGEAGHAPAVDIYALGAILYECLTGRPPFHGATPLDTLKLLAAHEILPIEKLQPNTPADLVAIAHKCLEREPKRRYGSAAEVSQDLQRFLDGKPTLARPIAWPGKAYKWVRRRPVLAVGCGLASTACVILLGLWISFTRQLEKERDKAIESGQLALEQSQRAQRNAGWAMEAVDKLITQVGDKELNNIPGMSNVRKKLLQASADFCQKFFEDSESGDPDALNDVGSAHRRLAKVYRALGENKEWLSNLQKAKEIHGRVVKEHPDKAKYLLELGMSLNNLSNAEGTVLGPDVAAATAEEAIEIKESLLKLEPTSREYRKSLAVSLLAIGPKLRSRDPHKAEKYYARAVEILDSLLAEQPNDVSTLESMAGVHRNWVALLTTYGNRSEAVKHAEKSVEVQQRIDKLEPGPMNSFALMSAIDTLGICYGAEGRYEEAKKLHREALDGLKKIVEVFPEQVECASSYLDAATNLGNIQCQLSQFDEAIDTLQKAKAMVDPSTSVGRNCLRKLARLDALTARAYLESSRFEQSLAKLKDSGALLDEAKQSRPESYEYVENLSTLAIIQLSQGDPAAAQKTLQHDWQAFCGVVKSHPQQVDFVQVLFRCAAIRLLIHLRADELDAAEQVLADLRNCQTPFSPSLEQLMNAAIESKRGEYESAMAIVEKHGQDHDVKILWPDHLPTYIVDNCLKAAQADTGITPGERQTRIDRCQKLLRELYEHALKNDWDIPIRRQTLPKPPAASPS